MASLQAVTRWRAQFNDRFLQPKLKEFSDSGMLPQKVVAELVEAQKFATQPTDKVRNAGAKYLSEVLMYIAMSLAMTDEMLEVIPALGKGKVAKIRELQQAGIKGIEPEPEPEPQPMGNRWDTFKVIYSDEEDEE